jgi:hypothetical protein
LLFWSREKSKPHVIREAAAAMESKLQDLVEAAKAAPSSPEPFLAATKEGSALLKGTAYGLAAKVGDWHDFATVYIALAALAKS